MSSSGIANTTAIGCSCVITTRPVVSVACTMLPRSTHPQSNASGDRRRDFAVGNIQFRAIDRAAVARDRALGLVHHRLLIVELLAREHALRIQKLIAVEGVLAVFIGGFILGHLALGLRQLNLIRTRVDLDEGVAFLYVLSFLVKDVLDRAVDTRLDGGGIEWSDGADCAQKNIQIAAVSRAPLIQGSRGRTILVVVWAACRCACQKYPTTRRTSAPASQVRQSPAMPARTREAVSAPEYFSLV